MQLKILNTKEKKMVFNMLKNQFGYGKKLDYVFLQGKDRLYTINRDIERIDEKKLNIDTMGLYFGTISNDEIRLSIEGSQIIGKDCKKNILELNEREMKDWLMGKELDKKTGLRGFVLLKHKNDFLGTGRIKDNIVLSYVPKSRRILHD